jgi:hypothetical protein
MERASELIAFDLLAKLQQIHGEIPLLAQVDFVQDNPDEDLVVYCYQQPEGELCAVLVVDNAPSKLDFRAIEGEMLRGSRPDVADGFTAALVSKSCNRAEVVH